MRALRRHSIGEAELQIIGRFIAFFFGPPFDRYLQRLRDNWAILGLLWLAEGELRQRKIELKQLSRLATESTSKECEQFVKNLLDSAQEAVDVYSTQRILSWAQKYDVEVPSYSDVNYFCKVEERQRQILLFGFLNFDPDYFLTDHGKRLIRREIHKAKSAHWQQIGARWSIAIGLVAAIVGAVSAAAAVYAVTRDDGKPVEITLKDRGDLSLPPAIWRNPATFDPLEHFFLFSTTNAPDLKWKGEIRSFR